jgi:hypothetical protein
MKWKNAQKDTLPKAGDEVLISVNGIYYISVYNASGNLFIVNDTTATEFSADEHLIYWTEFHNFPDTPT